MKPHFHTLWYIKGFLIDFKKENVLNSNFFCVYAILARDRREWHESSVPRSGCSQVVHDDDGWEFVGNCWEYLTAPTTSPNE